jgi:hypothetical protein
MKTMRIGSRLATLAGAAALAALAAGAAGAGDVVLVRGLNPTAADLAEWASPRQLSPALVADGTINVQYCEEHFPAGSQALRNLQDAVGTYNAIPGVAVHMEVVAAADSTTHPADPAAFAPADAVYVDYAYDMDPGAWAGASSSSCVTGGALRACSKGLLKLNGNNYVSDTDPADSASAPSAGVFMHELAHLFGLSHIETDQPVVNPANLALARATIHGHKLHGTDQRGTAVHALTIRFLREYYPDSSGSLDTDELTVHPNMVVIDPGLRLVEEFTADKSYRRGSGVGLTDGLNEVKLRWNPTLHGGAFESCAVPGVDPTWYAQFSEISASTVNTPFDAEFLVSTAAVPDATQWNVVATRSALNSYVAGQADFRQFEWTKDFALTWQDVDVPVWGPLGMVVRRLRFRLDPQDAVAERREGNNEWDVKICLFPRFEAGGGVINDCSEPCEP